MAETTEHDQAQGRVSTGRARLFALPRRAPAPRWKTSGLTACVVVEREPFKVAPRTTTAEPSYYLSNQTIPVIAPQATVTELAQAIRRPWGVESTNWIRDVTFNEDKIKTNSANPAQLMARLRSCAITLRRKASAKKLQAALEPFADSVADLESMLRHVKFL